MFVLKFNSMIVYVVRRAQPEIDYCTKFELTTFLRLTDNVGIIIIMGKPQRKTDRKDSVISREFSSSSFRESNEYLHSDEQDPLKPGSNTRSK